MTKFNLMADEPKPPRKPNNQVFGFIVMGMVIGVYALIIFDPPMVYQIHDYVWGR